MDARMRLSNAETDRLKDWALASLAKPDTSEAVFARQLYSGKVQGMTDRLRLALAGARAKAIEDSTAMMAAGGYGRLLKFAEQWQRPVFPVGGEDLKRLGVAAGPAMGVALKALETAWIESGFALSREDLLARQAGRSSAPT